jgi:hypothetical protein
MKFKQFTNANPGPTITSDVLILNTDIIMSVYATVIPDEENKNKNRPVTVLWASADMYWMVKESVEDAFNILNGIDQ